MEVAEEFCKYLDGDTSTGTASRKDKLVCQKSLYLQYRRFLTKLICHQATPDSFKRGILFEVAVLGSAACGLSRHRVFTVARSYILERRP